MTKWRPAPGIRVKALGLHWRAGRLLAAEVLDDSGRIKGVRPLGGTMEFGETAEETVIREFREELGVEVVPRGEPFFLENLFVHEGAAGHEIIILFDVEMPRGAFEAQTRLAFQEDNGVTCFAEWFDVGALDVPGAPALYPTGLKARLMR